MEVNVTLVQFHQFCQLHHHAHACLLIDYAQAAVIEKTFPDEHASRVKEEKEREKQESETVIRRVIIGNTHQLVDAPNLVQL
jgi:hypothetical protein